MTANKLTTAAQARAFALAGNATLTLVSASTGTRFTFKIQAPMKKGEDDEITGARDLGSDFRFVKVLTGPDNTADYRYLGYIRRGVYFHGNAKAKVGPDAPSARAFAWSWSHIAKDVLPPSLEVWHEGRCGRCNRLLTVPSSIASGFGPECAGKVGFAAEEV